MLSRSPDRVCFVLCLSAAGQEYQKENPAIKQLMQTSKQRMSILDKLGVSPAACVDPSDEEL